MKNLRKGPDCTSTTIEKESRMDHKHCCQTMQDHVEHQCDQHADPFDCPDHLICYSPQFDEYGIIIHDGGSSYITVKFCPWCGARLPKSKRDRWFQELEAMGFDDPFGQDIPKEYCSDAWHRKTAR